MTTALANTQKAEIYARLATTGDTSKLSPVEKAQYYRMACDVAGLNPEFQPFEFISFQGKERLYATKRATDQLRLIHGLSTEIVSRTETDGLLEIAVRVFDKSGRSEIEYGILSIKNLTGDARANAVMKCLTKAKRRATLAFCGLGILDETEVETIPNAVVTSTPTPAIAAPQAITVPVQAEEAQAETPATPEADPDAIFRKAVEIVTKYYVELNDSGKANFAKRLVAKFGARSIDDLTVPQIVELATIIKDAQTGKTK
jgi:hypothetical protein